ncbi:MAG: flavodoxin domain-containing protein [Candidatus Promineifilaceae bacterium]|nr:flavodoxin domain-containing protein [Candidatus Promineifilaceae bacterium]
MKGKVLVTYATKYGATAEIAVKIGQVLGAEGVQVDVLNVKEVRDLSPYSAVILGSAVYVGRWRKEAVQFLEHNEEMLTQSTVWLFSSGPTGEGDPTDLLQGWRLPDKVNAIADRIQVKDSVVFSGDLEVYRLNFFEKWMIKRVKAPTGDFRDWDAITFWAAAIADELKIPAV